jgi:hypothetical protein
VRGLSETLVQQYERRIRECGTLQELGDIEYEIEEEAVSPLHILVDNARISFTLGEYRELRSKIVQKQEKLLRERDE